MCTNHTFLFVVQEATLEEAEELLKRNYLRSTKVIDLNVSC